VVLVEICVNISLLSGGLSDITQFKNVKQSIPTFEMGIPQNYALLLITI
jgi:hypothetical protein